jgi:uncharacterized protein DUF6159
LDRIGRSWDLVGQSFAVLRSDKELLFLPVVSAGFSLSFSAIILGISALIYRPEILTLLATRPARPQLPQGMYACLFIFYLMNYSIVIFFNVVLVSIASDRLRGGHATLNDGLQIAWQRKGRIFQWAFLAATVGILLRALEDRLGWLGRMIVGWIGVAWSLATYFVAPILAAEDIGPMEALYRSAGIFKETWGEELVGGFSFGLIFFFLAIPGIVLIFGAATLGKPAAIGGVLLAVIYWLLLSVVSAAVQGVFTAALFQYATTKEVPAGFNRQDFLDAWRPKN